MATKTEEIIQRALALLESNPDGMHYSELVKELQKQLSSYARNTIHGTIWNLDAREKSKVFKPSRGLFRLKKFNDKIL